MRCDVDSFYYSELGHCRLCEKFLFWVGEDICCSVTEPCHPDFWKFIIVVILSAIAVIMIIFAAITVKKRLLEKEKMNRQYELENVDNYSAQTK